MEKPGYTSPVEVRQSPFHGRGLFAAVSFEAGDLIATYPLLILSQVYVPDPASVGQHMHDAAAEMVARGWRSVVLTSARGYDDPSRKYPSREVRDGVQIRRLALSSFGKRSILIDHKEQDGHSGSGGCGSGASDPSRGGIRAVHGHRSRARRANA